MFTSNKNAFLDSPPSLNTPPNSEASSYTLSSISDISSTDSTLPGTVNRQIFADLFSQNAHSVSFVSILNPSVFEGLSGGSISSLSDIDSFDPTQRHNFSIDSKAERAIFARNQLAPLSQPTRLLEPIPLILEPSQSVRRKQLCVESSSWVAASGDSVERSEREAIRDQLIQCFDSYQPDDELIINAENVTELPDCVGIVWHIRKLDLSGCRSLKSLPNVLHNFTRLNVLNLTDCSNLKALPPTLTALNVFAVLYLRGSGIDLSNPINSRVLKSPPQQPHPVKP